jgi:hypothetical protein
VRQLEKYVQRKRGNAYREEQDSETIRRSCKVVSDTGLLLPPIRKCCINEPQTILCDCSVAVRKICTKEKGKCLQGRAGLGDDQKEL